MPRWNDGLVDAFPVPLDEQLSKLTLKSDAGIREESSSVGETSLPQKTPFHFFSLPAELRNRVYHLVLYSKPLYRRADGTRRASRLSVLLASKRFHKEASYALYTTDRFMIFPLQQFTALPSIQELPLHYRILVANLEMVVGSSWTSPPKSWKVTKPLRRCLANLQNVQTLRVFVEFDPSHPAFRRYRKSYEFYTDFCGELLEDVLEAMPQIEYVQLDGNSGVDVHGPLVSRLREEALAQDKKVKWGREANWAHKTDVPADSPGAGSNPYASHDAASKVPSASISNAPKQSQGQQLPKPRIPPAMRRGLHDARLERVKDLD